MESNGVSDSSGVDKISLFFFPLSSSENENETETHRETGHNTPQPQGSCTPSLSLLCFQYRERRLG